MSQHDADIANQLFPAFRTDLNSLATALISNSIGAAAPATTFAGQWFYNETDDIIYIRNKDNDTWIPLGTLADDEFTPYFSGAAIAQATETVMGIMELATAAEATALTNATNAITPLTLASVLGTAAALGLVRYATLAEIDTATATDRAINVLEFGRTWKAGATIASAATLVEPSDANKGGSYYLSGTTTVAALWAGETAGKTITLVLTGAITFTHGANLIMPGSTNWVGAAGDVLTFRAEVSPSWRCLSAQRASGLPIVEPTETDQTSKIAIFQDQKASGTTGGATVAGSWITRTLQTVVENNITGCSLAGNAITLPAGDYLILADGTSQASYFVRHRLYNSSDSVVLGRSTNSAVMSISGTSFSSITMAAFTLAAPKNIVLQYRSQGAHADGLGEPYSFAGEVEVYASVTVIRQGDAP